MNAETKLFLGIIGATLIIIVGAVFFFSKPAPSFKKEDLIPSNAHTKGNKDAKAYLVEFSDFQCPACLAAKPAVDAVTRKYNDKLLFVYRHFPLDQHPFGQKAAVAAEAASAGGKFWEMYDLLFANQEKFSDTLWSDLAKELHLNVEEFDKALTDTKLKDIVLSDRDAGIKLGVNATPTFYLNGRKLDLSSFADLDTEIAKAVL